MNETQRRFLRHLRDAQPAGLRRSSIPKSCAGLVQELEVCGAVEFRPSRTGRGIALCVISDEAYCRFIAARLPQGLDVDRSAVTDRASAVMALADAKAVRHAVGEGIFIRSAKPGIEIRSTDGEIVIPISQLTASAGGSGVQLAPERIWTFAGELVVVENADAFWRYELVLPQSDLAILSGGNMSTRLVRWLGSPEMARCRVTHWGDYDPVGVCQYLRLLDACAGRVAAYAPPEVDELLPRYGKRRLVTHQSKYLDRLRPRAAEPYVRRMIDLFDKYRRGLEQEALLHRATAATSRSCTKSTTTR